MQCKGMAFFLHLFFPNRCPFCGVVIEHNAHHCEECAGVLPFVAEHFCAGCKQGECCCAEQGSPCHGVIAPFYYRDGAEQAVKALKFKDRLTNAPHLAYYMGLALVGEGWLDRFDVIIPVPMTAKKKRRRGYNQAEKLARGLAEEVGKPVDYKSFVKLRDTAEQHTLSATARVGNLSGAFRVKRRDVLLGRRVLLVDDVHTTGATMKECAQTLITAGVKEVVGIAACVVNHVEL